MLSNLEPMRALLEQGKTISFYMSSESSKDHGLITCQISSKNDEHHLVFADTIEHLFEKLYRRDVQGINPTDVGSSETEER